jgi:hypothetical protein
VQPTYSDDKVVLASYPRYTDAQAAVDRLSDARFPVEHTSIVGRDLRLVETVTGRLNYGRAALSGLAGGVWFGLLVGLFVALFAAEDTASWLALVLWGVLFGALAGMIFSLVAYAATGGRRDFVSFNSLVAAQYDVLVSPGRLDEARRLLGSGAAAPYPEPGGVGPGGATQAGPDGSGELPR